MNATHGRQRERGRSGPVLETSSSHAAMNEAGRAHDSEFTQSHADPREISEDDAPSREGADAASMPF